MSPRDNWNRPVSRRDFLGAEGIGAAALVLGRTDALASTHEKPGYGHPLPDPGGLIDLPRGFQHRILSERGSTLSTGAPVPGEHDGMAAFRGPGKTTLLVRNHELGFMDGAEGSVVGKNPYDREERGGTIGVVVGTDHREISSFVTSSGTRNNCAGGATPWGTWLTCEEDRTRGHGYVFEVDPKDPENDLSRTPIRAMGFFSHEAVDIDPATGIAYLTEDDSRGAIATNPEDERPGASRVSFLYRYVPNTRPKRPGALHKGGRLQVMTLEETPRRRDAELQCRPRDHEATLRRSLEERGPRRAARRCQGKRCRTLQPTRRRPLRRRGVLVRRYHRPRGAARADLSLSSRKRNPGAFLRGHQARQDGEPRQHRRDAVGGLWFAEDETILGDTRNRLVGITPAGEVYVFASNRLNDSEFAGTTFSPDGTTFFANLQNPGVTLAIWGSFQDRNVLNQREMAAAAPPASLAPKISGALAEAAERHGMSTLEAAAYERLGVQLV